VLDVLSNACAARPSDASVSRTYDAIIAIQERRDRLDEAIASMAAASEFTGVVNRLGCLRGMSTLTGFGLAVEIGDWTRLDGRRIGFLPGARTDRELHGPGPLPRRADQDRQRSRPAPTGRGSLASQMSSDI
jgi:hypothetical protein